jgi:2-hydroxychromene-2-carboxylate isomerase
MSEVELMKPKLAFFFFYGSIHSYLTVMRIGALAAAANVDVEWWPFNLREILIEQNNTSFAKNQVRLNYNWRDIERRAKRLGVVYSGRAPYPVDPDLLALRVGAVAAAEGWCRDYTEATFRAWFQDKRASGLLENVATILRALGKPVDDVIAQARAPRTDELIKAATDAARALAVFGSPTFAVGQEIFWGDDRLEDAVAYAKET